MEPCRDPGAGRQKATTSHANPLGVARAKRAKTGDTLPEIGIPLESQTPELQEAYRRHEVRFASILKLDGGVSSADNFTYTHEDSGHYFVVPANYQELMTKKGWDAFFAMLFKFGVRMKPSSTDFDARDATDEVQKFISGIVHRMEQLPTINSANATLKISGTTSKERGRATVDLLVLKRYHKDIALEKFLPTTSQVDGKGFLKHYLGILGGSQGSAALKNTADLVNIMIRKQCDKNPDELSKVCQNFTIPFNVVIDDIIRRKKTTETVNRKKVTKSVAVHFPKISNTPFILSDAEEEFFGDQEDPWEKTDKLANNYQGGVKVNEIERVRQTYSELYKAKQALTERYSSWKSRRLKAFKVLASVTRTKQQMEEWRLTNQSKLDALDNLPIMFRDCNQSKDWQPLKQVLADLHPRMIKDFKPADIFNHFTCENVRRAFGNLIFHDKAEEPIIEGIYQLMMNLTGEMTIIRSNVAKAVPKIRPQRFVNMSPNVPGQAAWTDADPTTGAMDEDTKSSS
jgi:hypothetical protein